MATGDQRDMLYRLRALLPPSWFPDIAPIRDGLLSAFAATASFIYGLIAFTRLQLRVATATGIFLDLMAFDFFGRRIKRKASQTDASLRATIQTEVLRERVTRAGVQKAVSDLTGSPVTIFEPFNPMDTGGFGVMFAFNAAGAWGSDKLPYTMFITAVEPVGAGIPSLSGLNNSWGGFGAGAFAFADLSTVSGQVTNQDIYDTIEATRAAGVTCWVNIGPPAPTTGRIGVDFAIGETPIQ